MIGFLRGTVHAFGSDYLLLDVNNVGYRINYYHPDTLAKGKEVTIYTYQNVREDEISLFGFVSLEEYDLFVKLISVKGLGPKTASNILAVASVDSIIEAIENGDVSFMNRMPGVGKKTASQIILDLKGKLVKALGYRNSEISAVLKKLDKDGSVNDKIRKALSLLAK